MNEIQVVMNRQADILNKIVKQLETEPGSENTPENQAMLRKELEYTTFLVDEFNSQLKAVLFD
jgi:hypothetical protein